MATVISGDTGVSQVQAGSINQDDLAANVVGKGPAFSAYLSANQSFSVDSPVKVLFNAEKFDTNNAFDTTTSRFQPTTPGYYLVATSVLIAGTGIGAAVVYLHKNGVTERTLAQLNTSITGGVFMGAGSCVVYLNGTTDYLEVFGVCIATSGRVFDAGSHFSGFLARAA